MFEAGKATSTFRDAPPGSPVEYDQAESRLDPLTGVTTIFAPHRGRRPEEYVDAPDGVRRSVKCPFCHRNEQMTPPPVWIGRMGSNEEYQIDPDGSAWDASERDPQWDVRVVPNKYPAVLPIEPTQDRSPKVRDAGGGLFQGTPIAGGHEVIIESPQHVQSLSELDVSNLVLSFRAFRDRLLHWRNEPGIEYLNLFKNVGKLAGASLRHTHSQLIAMNQIPQSVVASSDRMARYRARTGCCLQCDLLRGELKNRARIVFQDESLVAFCPFASRLPMLLRITTRQHHDCFERLDHSSIERVARLIGRAVKWIELIRPGASYNFYLNTRPPGTDAIHSDSHHWHIDLFPRMTHMAGFEWSSGCTINPIMPEAAAEQYRKHVIDEDPRRL